MNKKDHEMPANMPHEGPRPRDMKKMEKLIRSIKRHASRKAAAIALIITALGVFIFARAYLEGTENGVRNALLAAGVFLIAGILLYLAAHLLFIPVRKAMNQPAETDPPSLELLKLERNRDRLKRIVYFLVGALLIVLAFILNLASFRNELMTYAMILIRFMLAAAGAGMLAAAVYRMIYFTKLIKTVEHRN